MKFKIVSPISHAIFENYRQYMILEDKNSKTNVKCRICGKRVSIMDAVIYDDKFTCQECVKKNNLKVIELEMTYRNEKIN